MHSSLLGFLSLVMIVQTTPISRVADEDEPIYRADLGELVILKNRTVTLPGKPEAEDLINSLPVAVVTDPAILRRPDGEEVNIKELQTRKIWFVIRSGTHARVLIPFDAPVGQKPLVKVELPYGPNKGLRGWIEAVRVFPREVPDQSYVPKPGDVAFLYTDGINEKSGLPYTITASVNRFAFQEWERALSAKDDEGLVELEQKKQTAEVPSGTKVRALRFHEGRRDKEEFIRDAWEVRILNGKFRNNVVWVLADEITRPRPSEKSKSE